MKLISRLLRKNMSPARIAGFVLSNFIGLAIVGAGLQFYSDLRPLWQSDDSFVSSDYLVINRKVTGANTLGNESSGFTESQIADINAQPWVRRTGRFEANDYKVYASVGTGERRMSTYMFFESVPAGFVDVSPSVWTFDYASARVPVIISKDYLTLYNFGFASSAGLPQLSESLISGIPLTFELRSDDGLATATVQGEVVGFSSRLNTILVPEEFMRWSNSLLGSGIRKDPSRLIIDVNSPGDVAIERYLAAHDLEVAGDKSASQASYLLKVVTGVIIAIGALITILSLFILMLSISLLMERNRDKINQLLTLGYDTGDVAAPYRRIIIWSAAAAMLLSLAAVEAMRALYIGKLSALGAAPGNIWVAPAAVAALAAATAGLNILAVNRKVKAAWRLG